MDLADFVFSYKTILKLHFREKKFIKFLKKLIGLPYKYILELFRITFSINKKNLDSVEFDFSREKTLDELFIFFNSDKGSQVLINNKIIEGHNYSIIYEKYFSKKRSKEKIKILEIGSLKGASAASFLKFFNNPEIYCLDVNPFQMKYFSNKIKKLYINTRYRSTLKQVSDYLDNEFDIVIDDGSHNKRDQILTLNYFLPKLKRKGIYVIEDTCEYLRIPALNDDNFDYGVNEFVSSIFNTGKHYSKYLNDKEKKNIQRMINSFSLENGNFVLNNKNFPEIIFIEKK